MTKIYIVQDLRYFCFYFYLLSFMHFQNRANLPSGPVPLSDPSSEALRASSLGLTSSCSLGRLALSNTLSGLGLPEEILTM